ncbi:MAG: cytochrome-c oxidase, cbb3-type subunit III [Pseudomonadota bacterium]
MADQEKHVDELSGVETTGHVWDGLRELNNPLPRWWLYLFYATIVWSVVYWVFMPAWPGLTGHTKGIRNHSERANVELAIAELDERRRGQMTQLASVNDIQSIEDNPQLLQYAMVSGESLFGDNCATCHGAGGQGFVGYPSLVDDAWLWGGTFDSIKTTLKHGIRSTDPNTRFNMMQAYGRDGILKGDQIEDLVEYVVSISGREANQERVDRGAELFDQQCVSCHDVGGVGMKEVGAPNLTDAIWLYGGDRKAIRTTIYEGRGGVMPAWSGRFTDEQITALTVYVHSLGGGERLEANLGGVTANNDGD